ncbi:MAG: tetratricopeptide repeat protein [Bacteroidales bacterium]
MIATRTYILLILIFLSCFVRAQSEDVIACMRQASISENNKNYTEAIEFCTKALVLNAVYDEAYFRRGYYKYLLSDFTGALRDFNVTLKLNPEHVEAHLYKANCLQKTGSNVAALNEYNQARRLDALGTFSHVAKDLFGSVLGQ